jgi:hypothetical protein
MKLRESARFTGWLALALLSVAVEAADDDYGSRGNLWKNMTVEERQEVADLGERFKDMIDAVRSELLMVRETIRYAEARGFEQWDPSVSPSPGDRFYAVNRDCSMVLRAEAFFRGDAVHQQPYRLGPARA